MKEIEEKENTIDHMLGRLYNFKFDSAAGWAQDLTRKERKIIGAEDLKMIRKLSNQYGNSGHFVGTASRPIWKWIHKFTASLYKKELITKEDLKFWKEF